MTNDKPGWTSAYCEWARPHLAPADLATSVLDAMTRKLRDYDRLSAALTSAQAEATKNLERARKAEAERAGLCMAVDEYRAHRDRMREECDQAKVNLTQTVRLGSRAVSAMETLRSLLNVPEDGDVVGAVRRHLDAYARLLEERDRFDRMATTSGRKLYEAHQERDRLREELDALRAAKLGPDFFESLQWAKDFGEWYNSQLVKTDGPSAAKPTEPLEVSTPKPGPKLTPLRHRGTVSKLSVNEPGKPSGTVDSSAYTFDGAVLDVRYAGSRVVRWELQVRPYLHVTDYAGASVSTEEARADVNAILARYGYVLEAWP